MHALGAGAAYRMAPGVYLMPLRPAILPGNERATRAGPAVIARIAPGFEAWMQRVVIVPGGRAAA